MGSDSMVEVAAAVDGDVAIAVLSNVALATAANAIRRQNRELLFTAASTYCKYLEVMT
jgi:hypothetical protein